jgi:hypothetical protein
VHRARFVREVSEGRLDHHRIFDARDDAHRAAAARAGLDVDTEHALQALCPAHRIKGGLDQKEASPIFQKCTRSAR